MTSSSFAAVGCWLAGYPMQAASHVRPPDRTSRLDHCKASSTGLRCAMVAMQATPRRSREVCPAMAPKSGMHSKRGLLRMLSPTQTAWTLPDASALTAISIRSFGCVPLVTTARLDNVRPKVVFLCDMTANISRGWALVSRRNRPRSELLRSRSMGLSLEQACKLEWWSEE